MEIPANPSSPASLRDGAQEDVGPASLPLPPPSILSRRARNGTRNLLNEFVSQIYAPFVAKYQSEGTQYADFCFGNPHDPPLPNFVEALHLEASRGLDANCPPSLFQYQFRFDDERNAILRALRRRRGPAYETSTPDDVLVTSGAFAGLLMVLHSCTDAGGEVIVPSPDYFGYEGILQALECTPVYVPLSPDAEFDLDAEALGRVAANHPKARVLILTCPNNPTGRLYTRERLRELSHALQDANAIRAARGDTPIVLLSDEAYHRIVFPSTQHPFVSPAEEYEHTVSVYSYAKTCMAPSERLGWVVLGPRWPIETAEAMRDALGRARLFLGMMVPSYTIGRCIPSLEGDGAEGDGVCVDLSSLQRRRDALVAALTHEDSPFPSVVTPESGFYVLSQIPVDFESDADVCRMLGSEPYRLLVMPMSMTSQLSGWLRWSVTASDDMIDWAVQGLLQFYKNVRSRKESPPPTDANPVA